MQNSPFLTASCPGAKLQKGGLSGEAEPLRQSEKEDGRGLGRRTECGLPLGLPG